MFSVKITSEEFKNARKTSLPQTFLGLERVTSLRTSAWAANEKPVNLDMFLGEVVLGNHTIIVMPSFRRNSVFKLISVHTKTQS